MWRRRGARAGGLIAQEHEKVRPATAHPRPNRDKTRPATPHPRPNRDKTRPATPHPRPNRDKTRPATPHPRPNRDKTRPASPKTPKSSHFCRAGRKMSRFSTHFEPQGEYRLAQTTPNERFACSRGRAFTFGASGPSLVIHRLTLDLSLSTGSHRELEGALQSSHSWTHGPTTRRACAQRRCCFAARPGGIHPRIPSHCRLACS